MMNTLILYLPVGPALLLVLLGSAPGAAEQTMTIAPEVETVVTGGQWKSDKLSGTYRVIVLTGGFEHIVSQVQIDWITAADGRDNPPRVLSSKIAETASWSLFRPRIVKSGGVWRVLLDGIETHSTPTPLGTWMIDLGAPGTLKATLRCTKNCNP